MQESGKLIKQCQQGSSLAWEALVRGYQSKVFAVAVYYMKNRDDAEDVAQEVFVKVYCKLGDFNNESESFQPWMMAIARNCCLDRLRKSKTHLKYQDRVASNELDLAVTQEGPESLVDDEQQKKLLYAALDQFSDTNRDILLLKDIQGLKNEEVAEILSLPIGTVKSRSSRARVKLAKMLGTLFRSNSERSEVV